MAERFFGWHTIYGVDGEHSEPYMTRVWIGRLRLHIFYRGDNDPDPHDHPWDFWTFPLTSYVEEVTVPILNVSEPDYWTKHVVVHALRLHYREAKHCHRVIGRATVFAKGVVETYGYIPANIDYGLTNDRKIITIVWRGRNGRKWGFLRNRDGNWCWTPWKEYVFGGGKHAPCEPPLSVDMIDEAEANIRADYRAGTISKEQFQKELLIVASARPQASAEVLDEN